MGAFEEMPWPSTCDRTSMPSCLLQFAGAAGADWAATVRAIARLSLQRIGAYLADSSGMLRRKNARCLSEHRSRALFASRQPLLSGDIPMSVHTDIPLNLTLTACHWQGLEAWVDAAALPWSLIAAATQQMQCASSDAWRGLRQDITLEAEDVSSASGPHEILESQTEFIMTEAARCARTLEQCLAAPFDVQAHWIRQAEAWTFDVLRPALDEDVRLDTSTSTPFFELPDDLTANGVLHWTHSAWTELSKALLDALQHDLESEAITAKA
jgi:hypothetical protein